MPNLGAFHPQVVHFVVVLALIGVALRVLSFVIRRPFVSQAATLCLVGGAIAAMVAVKSGRDAHGPVERIPGVRDAVGRHEEHGETARTVLLVVAALELVGVGLAYKNNMRFARWAYAASGLVGLFAASQVYEAGEHGGELVYSYGGGPGLRTGNAQDIERLLIAGLYNESREDRKAGRLPDAARLIDEMARREPSNPEVQLLRVESLMLDRKDYASAVAAADSVTIAANDARLRARQATLKADAYIALGKSDSARAVLTAAVAAMPQNTRLKAKLDSLR